MRYDLNGVEFTGHYVDIEIVDNSNDKIVYITNSPACDDSYDIQLIGLRGKDVELVYSVLGKVLGKIK